MTRIDATPRPSGPAEGTIDACAGCASRSSRRAFPLRGAATVGGLLAGLAVRPDLARALPTREDEGRPSGPIELMFRSRRPMGRQSTGTTS
ncbi:MAG: hypothetical protein PVH00_02040 [Gemmatimonadota bacterium]|jgi:hypothetical protein